MARVNEPDYDEYDFYAEWSGLRESHNIREARALTDADYEGCEDEE